MNFVKKIIAILTSIVFACPTFLFARARDSSYYTQAEQSHEIAEQTSYDCKISYNADAGFWFINGFDFDSYNPGDPSLTELVNNEVNKVRKITNEHPEKYPQKYVVAGHSQGGPSALAFAKILKETSSKEDFEKLGAVVTVSGIDKGLKALDGGFGPLKSKLYSKAHALWAGFCALFSACPQVEFCGLSLLPLSLDLVLNEVIFPIVPEDVEFYLREAWYGCDSENIQQLYDMMPGSDFIKENVCESKVNYCKYLEKYTDKIVWKSGWLGIPYFVFEKVPVYKTIAYTSDLAKIPDEVPAAYIVGLNNNSLGMLNTEEDPVLEAKIRSCVTELFCLYTMGGVVNMALSVLNAGCLNFPMAAFYTVNTVFCMNAAIMCGDVDGQLNDLLSSSEHDGLVAKESQYIPKTWAHPLTSAVNDVHTNVLCDNDTGYKAYYDYNHRTIAPTVNPEVKKYIQNIIKIVSTDKESN